MTAHAAIGSSARWPFRRLKGAEARAGWIGFGDDGTVAHEWGERSPTLPEGWSAGCHACLMLSAGQPRETRDLFYPCDPISVDAGGRRGILLGRDLEAQILVLDSGVVGAALDGSWWPINSSASQYAESLRVVGDARDRYRDNPDAMAVQGLAKALEAIDSAAYREPDSYWASIIEQIEHKQF